MLRRLMLLIILFLSLPLCSWSQGQFINGSLTVVGELNSCSPATASGTTYACNLDWTITQYNVGGYYSFKADVANTGAATINYNAAGAKTIKKLAGNVTTDLIVGDICASQMVVLLYDGTNMQMVSPLCTAGASSRTKTCVWAFGDPGAASGVLADDNDAPVACPNDFGVDWTITTVACYANAGSPTVTPILTGGTATSVLTGAMTCGTAAWAAGTVQGTAPVVHSFSGTGATCSSTPCSIDINLTTAGGTAKYVVVKIVGTIP